MEAANANRQNADRSLLALWVKKQCYNADKITWKAEQNLLLLILKQALLPENVFYNRNFTHTGSQLARREAQKAISINTRRFIASFMRDIYLEKDGSEMLTSLGLDYNSLPRRLMVG